MSDVKLKPCPFCGGEASINRPSGRMLFCVVCDDCDANGGYYFTEEDAARAWNDRAERTCRIVEVETGELADYSDTDEVIFHCKSCHAERGIFSYDEDGNVFSQRPEYCPNCGARVKGSNSMPLGGEGR